MLNVAKNRHLISFLVTENSAEFVTFSEIGQISDLNISQFYLSSTNIWIFQQEHIKQYRFRPGLGRCWGAQEWQDTKTRLLTALTSHC